MAVLFAQNEGDSDQGVANSVLRIPLTKMKEEVPYEVNVSRYTGLKKTQPPKALIEKKVLSLAVLSSWACARVSLEVAKKKTSIFLQTQAKMEWSLMGSIPKSTVNLMVK